MKYKIMILIMAVAAVVIALTASVFKTDDPNGRVHQHLESRQPSAGCNCDKKTLCTHLPLIVIDTGGEKIPGDFILNKNGKKVGETKTGDGQDMLEAKIRLIDNQETNNHPNDKASLKSTMKIRIRGNSSRFYPKKGYLVRLTEKDGSYKNHEVLGMDAHYEWALHGPYLDKSLIRNYMWYNIAGEMMEYAPDARFCEVIIDGKYQGLYLLTETITSGKESRLNLTEPMGELNQTGFVVRLDRGSDNPMKNIETFTGYTYRTPKFINIEYPRESELTAALTKVIAQEVSDFEKALYSFDYDTDDYGYWNNIDTDSFVDYAILKEFTQNLDACRFSTYLYKDVGGRFKLAVWDFDSACGNYIPESSLKSRLDLPDCIWYFMLMKDEYFNQKLLRRYKELRKSWLSEEFLFNYIDETEAYLGDAVARNFQVWSDSFDDEMLRPAERNLHSHKEAVEQLKTFIHERGTWLDQHLEIILQYSHESKTKKFNH